MKKEMRKKVLKVFFRRKLIEIGAVVVGCLICFFVGGLFIDLFPTLLKESLTYVGFELMIIKSLLGLLMLMILAIISLIPIGWIKYNWDASVDEVRGRERK